MKRRRRGRLCGKQEDLLFQKDYPRLESKEAGAGSSEGDGIQCGDGIQRGDRMLQGARDLALSRFGPSSASHRWCDTGYTSLIL